MAPHRGAHFCGLLSLFQEMEAFMGDVLKGISPGASPCQRGRFLLKCLLLSEDKALQNAAGGSRRQLQGERGQSGLLFCRN